MRPGLKVLLKTVATAAAAMIAVAGLRSDNRFQEVAGAILLVVLVGWLTVRLSHARKRLVK
jgi:hypothetical protein